MADNTSQTIFTVMPLLDRQNARSPAELLIKNSSQRTGHGSGGLCRHRSGLPEKVRLQFLDMALDNVDVET